jgi:DNA invertase Pin-like site-specific DNA recombinase
MTKPVIAYIRVSTARQGRSGLGLEAQEAAIARFCEVEGFEVVRTFQETETGKGADALERRPELAAALAEAKRRRRPVLVAKLDRLSRDVAFIAGLMSQRVPFIVAEIRAAGASSLRERQGSMRGVSRRHRASRGLRCR